MNSWRTASLNVWKFSLSFRLWSGFQSSNVSESKHIFYTFKCLHISRVQRRHHDLTTHSRKPSGYGDGDASETCARRATNPVQISNNWSGRRMWADVSGAGISEPALPSETRAQRDTRGWQPPRARQGTGGERVPEHTRPAKTRDWELVWIWNGNKICEWTKIAASKTSKFLRKSDSRDSEKIRFQNSVILRIQIS